MPAIVYGNDFSFRSEGERRQFHWFWKALHGDHILDNNFYIFQRNPLRLWEIDFCIISEEQIFLIEHKSSTHFLSGVTHKVRAMPRCLLDSLREYNGIPEEDLPFVSSAIIVDKPRSSERPSDPLIHCVSSENIDDTRCFIKEVMGRAPRNKTKLDLGKVYKLVTRREPTYQQERGINERTFEIFDKVSEFADKFEKGDVIPETDIETLIHEQIKECSTLYHYASKILISTDEARSQRGLPPLFLHRPELNYLRKFRPVYFVAMIESETDDYTSHFQLSLHIGNGDRFNLGEAFSKVRKQDPRLRHLAVKLAIFRDMDFNRLSAFIKRLRDDEIIKERFRELILGLNEKWPDETERYYLLESDRHYKNPTIQVIDQGVAGRVIDIIMDYNRPEKRSRNIDIVKFFFWYQRRVRDRFRSQTSAIRILGDAFEALLPLHDFMTGHD